MFSCDYFDMVEDPHPSMEEEGASSPVNSVMSEASANHTLNL
jgi:hypothetical protein